MTLPSGSLERSRYSFFSASHEGENFDNAKRRIVAVAGLNAHIREVFGEFAMSAMSEDRLRRLQSIAEASERIDHLLTEFKPEE